MLNILDLIIYLFIYICLFIGIWFIVYPIFSPFYNRFIVSSRFRITTINSQKRTKKAGLIGHVEMLLSITYGVKSFYSLLTFFIITGFLFGACFVILFNNNNQILFNLLISTIIGSFPYLVLRIKLHNIRVTSSYEAEDLIIELINQYKINHYNMIEAIDESVPRLIRQPYSQKALFKLCLAVKQYRDQIELEEIIKEFNYSINTSWSLLLANNLFLSIEYGDNVTESLDDILMELKDLKKINEKNKQYNHETFVMIKYIAPSIYLLSVYAMFTIFGFNFDKFINFQFKNPIGFKFFILIIIFIFLNYLIYFLIKKQKNDF